VRVRRAALSVEAQNGSYRFGKPIGGVHAMPKLSRAVPKYRKHKATGQAVVTISGRDRYLGRYGTQASKMLYDRLVSEWLASDRMPAPAEPQQLRVKDPIICYWKFAKQVASSYSA
jgi:hypothetical protein